MNLPTKFNNPNYRDFTIRCVFPSQLTYDHIADDFYYVPMESGKLAVYHRTSSGYYGGTGQKDWHFNFLHYKGNI